MCLGINEVMYGGSSVLYDLFQRGQHHLVDIDARQAGKHKQHGIGHLIATKAIAFLSVCKDAESGVGAASQRRLTHISGHRDNTV